MTDTQIVRLEQDLIAKMHEEITARNSRMTRTLAAVVVALVINIAIGLIALGRMGAKVDRVIDDTKINSESITLLKEGATSGAREYMARANARDEAMQNRVKRLEDSLAVLPIMAADLATIKTKLEFLQPSDHDKKP